MGERRHHMDREIINRYTDQPARLPAELRSAIEAEWGGSPVQLYALADLDAGLRLGESWVALGPNHLAIARRSRDGGAEGCETTAVGWSIRSVPRSLIEDVRESPGLSGTVLTFLGLPPP